MRTEEPEERIEEWLRNSGWVPGRDVAAKVDEHIAWRVADSARQGYPLTPSGKASGFLSAYGFLELPKPTSRKRSIIFDPTFGYEGDAEDIRDLAQDVGGDLFPVGYETEELGIILAEENGRFFYLHSTGPYYLGDSEKMAFSCLMTGGQEEAEDYFV